MCGARQNDELPVLEWELLVEVEQGLVYSGLRCQFA